MDDIYYINRASGKTEVEQVYGRWFLSLFYGSTLVLRIFSAIFLPLLSRIPSFSKFYGYLQQQPRSRKKVAPFIKSFGIDSSEFADPVSSFRSFNDFFIRKLKPECRPIDPYLDRLAMPADGRYLVFPNLHQTQGFYVKGQKFDLRSFLQNDRLAPRYEEGAMMIARLCPTDYHRFHFPCKGIPSKAYPIKGALYSVNPIAVGKQLRILWENKRMITELRTEQAGVIALVEVGATCVGTIHQTYLPDRPVEKGEEKGYFSFGGSCLVFLFEKGRIGFDGDLIANSAKHLETRGIFGSSFATIQSK